MHPSEILMNISLSKIRGLLWFVATTLVGFSFPLQVLAGSPYLALAPYVVILAIYALYLPSSASRRTVHFNVVDLYVVCFGALVVIDSTAQAAFGYIENKEAVSAIAIFLLPISFYWAFRAPKEDVEMKAVYLGIATAGLIGGLYFAYDSYLKLALGQVSDYANSAFQYSLTRAGQDAADANQARISTGSRSFGLLELHAVSGTWVIFGAIATIALLDTSRKWARRFVTLIFGMLLLAGLNFTTIVAYVAVVFYSEVACAPRRHKIEAGIRIAVYLALAAVLAVGTLLPFLSINMSEYIGKIIDYQAALATTGNADGVTMVGLLISYSQSYIDSMVDHPVSLLFGEGFSTFGMPKGGDIGMVETLARLGMPMFATFVFLVTWLMRLTWKKLNASECNLQIRDLRFATSVTVVLFITECHYSVWSAKSVLPFAFLSLALYRIRLSKPLHSCTPSEPTNPVLA